MYEAMILSLWIGGLALVLMPLAWIADNIIQPRIEQWTYYRRTS